MTISNKNLNHDVINTINTLLEQKMNAPAAFKLTRILKEIEPLIEAKMSAEKRIYNKWLLVDENGDPVRPLDENGEIIPDAIQITDVQQFDKEMRELNEIETNIPYDKLNFDEMGVDTIKPKDILLLDFMIM